MIRVPLYALVLGVVWLGVLASCSSDDSVSASEAQFELAFIEPLEAAGLDYTVDEVCHYEREESEEPWHLQISVAVDAGPGEVADALTSTIDVIQRDRSPMGLQQYEGEPGRGWNGVLEPRGEGTILGVTRNNVEVDGTRPPVGWLPVCAFP